jgi:predicted proteasome-type protease
MLDAGMVFASDSRTNAGVDNFAKFCKMTVFERPGDRVVVMLSSGSLAGTQAVISRLSQRPVHQEQTRVHAHYSRSTAGACDLPAHR